MQIFLESETSEKAGVAGAGSRKMGGGVVRDLTFLSSVYLKQELNNLLLIARANPRGSC